jgi:hypothetical protein
MFYLRQTRVKMPSGGGKYIDHTFYTYWNYRGTNTGILHIAERNLAKAALLLKFPDADFWR